MTFEPDGYERDLRDIRGVYLEGGGMFSVLVDGGRVVGTVAALPHEEATAEVKRFYLDAAYRGRGWGRALMDHVERWAAAAGFQRVEAWSDARLTRAHVVYQRLGYRRIGERRIDDVDQSTEYGFEKRLAP
jgi:GNAT superfamily N-acetyltransferase